MLSVFTSSLLVVNPMVKIVDAGDITTYSDSSTSLTLSTPKPEEPVPPPPPPVLGVKPRINWYDLQNATGISKLNSQIDVNQEYKFCISISSAQGWDDIEYINITAWYDNGDDSTTYNDSGNQGGNLNMFLQYENTTGTANYTMLWPDDEVTKRRFTETVVTDECHKLTFSFKPGYQLRYAPGDGSWDYTTNAINDIWSWNFKISVTDSGEDASEPSTVWVIGEFGVDSYTEIISTGLTAITGYPGDTPAYNDSYISIETRSNGNYSLAVNITNLTHEVNPSYTIQNTSILTAGGELSSLTLFSGIAPHYYYNGSGSGYTAAEDNGTSKITNDIEWAVNIQIGQYTGDYDATVYYILRTQI